MLVDTFENIDNKTEANELHVCIINLINSVALLDLVDLVELFVITDLVDEMVLAELLDVLDLINDLLGFI